MQLEQAIRNVVRQEINSALKDRGVASRAWVKALHLSRPKDFEDAELGLSRLERLNQRIETLEKQARKLFAVNNNNTDHIKHLKTMFESIQSIAVEGPEFEPSHVLFRKIAKEAGKGYDLCQYFLKER